jgi:hypothetical protein
MSVRWRARASASPVRSFAKSTGTWAQLAGHRTQPLCQSPLEGLGRRVVNLERHALRELRRPVSPGVEAGAEEHDLVARGQRAQAIVDLHRARPHELLGRPRDLAEERLAHAPRMHRSAAIR